VVRFLKAAKKSRKNDTKKRSKRWNTKIKYAENIIIYSISWKLRSMLENAGSNGGLAWPPGPYFHGRSSSASPIVDVKARGPLDVDIPI
jgi:hypothetical protein